MTKLQISNTQPWAVTFLTQAIYKGHRVIQHQLVYFFSSIRLSSLSLVIPHQLFQRSRTMTNNQRKRKMDVLTNLTSSSKRMLSTPPDCITISSDSDSSDYEDEDAAMKGLKPEKAFSDYQFSYLEAAGNCQEMTFTTELFKVVYANCGKPDTSPPIRDFPLKLTKVVSEPSSDSGLWVCSSIVLETIVSSGWEIQPYRLMNRKELAVYLVTGYANMKRNGVLMRAERLSKKKVVRHLEFNG
ncbi:hypothetical protein LINGRAHAP2_LOCUS2756 [Linum grandiflorum]